MPSNTLPIAFVSAGDIVAATVSLSIFGIVVVLLRFWVRISHRMGIQLDDWLILTALLFLISIASVSLYGVSQKMVGYPSEEYTTTEEQMTALSTHQELVELIYWISWLLILPANGLIKLSTLFLYRRIFPIEAMSTLDIVSKIMVVICAVWTVAFFFTTAFGCGIHIACAWGSYAKIASCCSDKLAQQDALLTTDIITDVMVWMLPIPVVCGMAISTSRKLGVIAIFLLAACSLAAAVVRLTIQIKIYHEGYEGRTNASLTLSTKLYWSFLESGIALIASCLPMTRLFFRVNTVSSALTSVRSHIGRPTESLDGDRIYSVSTLGQLEKRCPGAILMEHAFALTSLTRLSSRSRSEDYFV